MFKEEFQSVCEVGKVKIRLLKQNPFGYFIASMLAGMFVAFGPFSAFVMGTPLQEAGAPIARAVMGFCFVIALSLVVFAGAELFTGNTFIMAASSINKNVAWGKTFRLILICYAGNLAGSALAAGLFQLTGITDGAVGRHFADITEIKMNLPVIQLLTRAILCNTLVCLASWCSIKIESETAKFIMIFWCVFTFMICGFEHSVANMSTMVVGLLNRGTANIHIAGYIYNLFFTSIGNMVGGVLFVAAPYYLISNKNNK